MLATGLPATATAAHLPVAWVGLDALEALGLIATGLLAARGDRRHALAAAATATLLAVDVGSGASGGVNSYASQIPKRPTRRSIIVTAS
ncbi:hypothetical protein ACIBI3_21555 [Actinomadura luteofluorescens]|uniref:hypothetical protein n=1 Tax=Actinomadura luteofluorescens TaxID=46163 RepID=UPI00346CCDA2